MSYLASLLSQLSEKQEQLSRLKTCESELQNLQGEFRENQKLLKEPQLTSVTWAGDLADTFESIRKEADTSYKDISDTQLNAVLKDIADKILSLIQEIQLLEIQIAAERARMESEESKGKE
ncbi:YwqH-like family protein [Metabacillus fastidiosus]|uniref:YwqH-like family protein n=1 Tax=Metabacillus fastidiosus TaxID=1458 RepID=UPI003D28C632